MLQDHCSMHDVRNRNYYSDDYSDYYVQTHGSWYPVVVISWVEIPWA